MATAMMESGGTTPVPAASTPNTDGPAAQRRTRICVYCGSSPGSKPEHMEAARQLARVMAANNIQLGQRETHPYFCKYCSPSLTKPPSS